MYYFPLYIAEAEKKRFRDKFLYAEQELAAAKQREQSLQEQLLKEVDSFGERLRNQIHLHSELEVVIVILHHFKIFIYLFIILILICFVFLFLKN